VVQKWDNERSKKSPWPLYSATPVQGGISVCPFPGANQIIFPVHIVHKDLSAYLSASYVDLREALAGLHGASPRACLDDDDHVISAQQIFFRWLSSSRTRRVYFIGRDLWLKLEAVQGFIVELMYRRKSEEEVSANINEREDSFIRSFSQERIQPGQQTLAILGSITPPHSYVERGPAKRIYITIACLTNHRLPDNHFRSEVAPQGAREDFPNL
jgi:hypothetical protein